MEYLVQNLAAVQHRREQLHGREHLVVPMTMIVPGVLNGSKGSLFYPPDEVGKDPTPWNGMPITVRHPVRDGRNISARDPDVLNTQGIGVVLRARSGNKLRAEAWIDIDKANKVDPRVVQSIQMGKPLEISTGLFTDNYPAEDGATFNGKPYQWVARNYRPDHLAILLDEKGACSISDGCGLGVNSTSINNYSVPKCKGNHMNQQDLESNADVREMMAFSSPIRIIANKRRIEMAERRTNAPVSTSGPRYLTEDEQDVEEMAPKPFDWNSIAQLPSIKRHN